MRDVLPVVGVVLLIAALCLPAVRQLLRERRRAREEGRYYPRLLIGGNVQRRLFDAARAMPELQNAENAPHKIADLREKALRTFERQPTYSTFYFETFNVFDHIGVSYRADFQSPHRVHVLQFLPENDWVDEWIIFDGSSFTNAGLWAESPDQTERYQRLQEKLSQATYLRILATHDPVGVRTGRFQKAPVVEITFSGPFGSDMLDLDFAPNGRTVDEEDRLSLVFDRASAALVRVLRHSTLIPNRFENLDDPPQGLIRKDTHVAFASHGEDIEVNPPPWLNATLQEDGHAVITDTRMVPQIPFH